MHAQEEDYASQVPSFRTLPRILLPRRNAWPRPPVMHYGWPVTDLTFLLEHAPKYNCSVYSITYDESDDEDNFDADEDPPHTKRLNEFLTAMSTLDYITGEIGGDALVRTVQLVETPQGEGKKVLSLYTNYTLKRAPEEALIKALQEFLKLEGELGWYLDSDYSEWHNRSVDYVYL